MKKKEIYTGTVKELKFPNKGIVCTDEGDVTVKGVLPGQTISFMLTKVKNGRFEGRLIEVLEPAPDERVSLCPHFGICGGCTYQNLPYEAELRLKNSQVQTILDRAVKGDYVYEGIIPSPLDEEYRNKMEFSFGNEVLDGPLTLGMHRAGRFNDVVTVDGCRIVDGDYRLIIRKTLDFFSSRNIPFYRKHTEEGYLRHLVIRKGRKIGEILLLIETTSQLDFDMGEYAKMLLSLEGRGEDPSLSLRKEKCPVDIFRARIDAPCAAVPRAGEDPSLSGKFAGILHLRNDNPADNVQGSDITLLYGRDYFYDEILGLSFRITPFSFFQTNTCGAELLYSKAREYALSVMNGDKVPVIFDLYSGTGTIGQIMSKAADKVIGIEIVSEAVEAARENAAANHLDNTEFIAGDVLKELDRIEEKPDIIILDPPRDGCAPKALSKIIDYGCRHIIYISCKITSLERDLLPLQEAGYRVIKAAAVDMFPNTANIEVATLLERAG